jgi:hypothetical protein
MRFYNRQHRHYCGIDLHESLGRERLRRSPFATRRVSLNRCWVQPPQRTCASAGNKDSPEGERDRVSLQRSRLAFRRLGF